MISSANFPISAPPDTRPQVVSKPSRISFVIGAPSRSWNVSNLGPLLLEIVKLPKPCVLCMERLRLAMSVNNSPDTGSLPPTPMRTCWVPPISSFWLPRFQLLFRKSFRIAGEFESFQGQHRRCRMVSVRATGNGRKTRDEHVWPKLPDDPHHVAQYLLPVPNSQGLAIILGKTEINCPRKELPAAINASSGEQFLRANHSNLVANFRAEHILTTIAARKRKVGCAVISAPGEIGDQFGIFIVGMRRDIEHAAHFAEAVQLP